MAVQFTQYLRPHGHKKSVSIDLAPEVENKASEILAAGFRFECEVLSIGNMVSFTITGYDPGIEEEADLVSRLCTNGPSVPEAVSEMIMEFEIP